MFLASEKQDRTFSSLGTMPIHWTSQFPWPAPWSWHGCGRGRQISVWTSRLVPLLRGRRSGRTGSSRTRVNGRNAGVMGWGWRSSGTGRWAQAGGRRASWLMGLGPTRTGRWWKSWTAWRRYKPDIAFAQSRNGPPFFFLFLLFKKKNQILLLS